MSPHLKLNRTGRQFILRSWYTSGWRKFTKAGLIIKQFANTVTFKRHGSDVHPFRSDLISIENMQSKLIKSGTDEFIRSMSSVFAIAHCFGLMAEIDRPGSRRWQRLVLLWSRIVTLLIITAVALSLRSLIRGLQRKSALESSVSAASAAVTFYGISLCSQIVLARFARLWRVLRSRWVAAEARTPLQVRPQPNESTRVRLITVLLLTGAFVEHALSVVSNADDCDAAQSTPTPAACLRRYVLNSHPFFFDEGYYSPYLAVLIFLVSNLATFVWNFQDLFIILMSLGLTWRYQRINRFVGSIDFDHMSHSIAIERSWRIARELLATQAALVREVDLTLGPITLISLFNNFYFICLQLYQGVAVSGSPMDKVYRLGSFAWLVSRATLAVLSAASVHDHSQRAMYATFACPPHQYTDDVRRLHAQLATDQVALTGMRFFDITRSFLLKVISGIATYEIVLLQFQKSDDTICATPTTPDIKK